MGSTLPAHTVHLASSLSHTIGRSLTLFLEVILIPAALITFLGSAGEVGLAVGAVFLWRLLAMLLRFTLVGMLPLTSLLTLAMLTAKTGTSAGAGLAGSPSSSLTAYVLPGCIASAIGGVYFLWSARRPKPVVASLATDFVDLTEESQSHLMPLFRWLTVVIGGLHLVFALAGTAVVLTLPAERASVWVGTLAVASPVTVALACVGVGVAMLRALRVRLCLRHPASAVEAPAIG